MSGLLQTEDYARAVIRAGLPHADPNEVQRRVMARMARRTLLGREDPPKFHAVLGEAVLRHQVGGPDVMREQMHALLTATRRPNVSVQVLRFSSGETIGLEGPFMHLEFPDDIDPDISYIEDISGGKFIEREDGNNCVEVAEVRHTET